MNRPNLRKPAQSKLAQILTIVVKELSCPQQILPAVNELGRRHAGYGVRDENYATVGEALLWTLESKLGEAFNSELREAWGCAYSFLASHMQRAASEALQPG